MQRWNVILLNSPILLPTSFIFTFNKDAREACQAKTQWHSLTGFHMGAGMFQMSSCETGLPKHSDEPPGAGKGVCSQDKLHSFLSSLMSKLFQACREPWAPEVPMPSSQVKSPPTLSEQVENSNRRWASVQKAGLNLTTKESSEKQKVKEPESQWSFSSAHKLILSKRRVEPDSKAHILFYENVSILSDHSKELSGILFSGAIKI